jgi:hypothetical protein
MTSIKFKETQSLYSSTIDWRKTLINDQCRKLYNDAALVAMTVCMDYEEFNDVIQKSGANTALSLKEQCEGGWYVFSRNDLLPIIDEKNQLVHTLHQGGHLVVVADLLRCSLKHESMQVKDMVLIAKLR